MGLWLGIDTGGTFTDAALVDSQAGRVLAWSKALTTHADLSRGVVEALDRLFAAPGAAEPGQVELVGLSTTLATNAIIEGASGRASLVLIGYDQGMLQSFGLEKELVVRDVIHLAGGHDLNGEQAAPLDEEGLAREVAARAAESEAYAVSAYFSVKNPAHELRARQIIERVCGRPVTCGHELSSRLDSVRRATTAALNAGLIPFIRDLVERVGGALKARGVAGRLMVVKGDGSLVDAAWALQRPIETILSGPAASVVGAWHLAQGAGLVGPAGDMWVVDMGGTTTDVALLQKGRPRLNPDGARVGPWRTMVEAVDVRTRGLGGDSLVGLGQGDGLSLGPRRVRPLCLLASRFPDTLAELRRQLDEPPTAELAGRFLGRGRPPGRALRPWEAELLGRLDQGPLSLAAWETELRCQRRLLPPFENLVRERLAGMYAFTPSDALHALGRWRQWEAEASRLGARLLGLIARRDPDDLCRQVVAEASLGAAVELASQALAEEGLEPDWALQPAAERLLMKALGAAPAGSLACRLRLLAPVAGIGAPAAAYLPAAAESLGAAYLRLEHAAVANAVGAVAGGVVLRQRVEIKPRRPLPGVRVFLPDGVKDFARVEDAVAFATAEVGAWLKARALGAGAGEVSVEVTRRDPFFLSAPEADDPLYLGTELDFTAWGRPSLG
ncbi:MAG: hydantoinase/oxoprolinase N-terminal domain-containing protein [Thermodesulfobacteriota bacterium]